MFVGLKMAVNMVCRLKTDGKYDLLTILFFGGQKQIELKPPTLLA